MTEDEPTLDRTPGGTAEHGDRVEGRSALDQLLDEVGDRLGMPVPERAFYLPLPAPGGQAGSPWEAFETLRALLAVVPNSPDSHSRLGGAVEVMRATTEEDLFGGTVGESVRGDDLYPVHQPRGEINRLVASSRKTLLELLDAVDLEPRLRDRLRHALGAPGDFLEEDNRGTLDGVLNPTGPTAQKARNNSKLDALAAFLLALRDRPAAVARYARWVLNRVAVPPDVLSVDLATTTITFRGTRHVVSHDACVWVQMLLEAGGELVTGGQLENRLGQQKINVSRIKNQLPPGLCEVITTTRQGSRLDLDLLLLSGGC